MGWRLEGVLVIISRNLASKCTMTNVYFQSCIKVALDFVSPENVEECIRVAGELRSLPRNHRAKEDKLEVRYWNYNCIFLIHLFD